MSVFCTCACSKNAFMCVCTNALACTHRQFYVYTCNYIYDIKKNVITEIGIYYKSVFN